LIPILIRCGTDEKYEKHRTVNVCAEIRTEHVWNTSEDVTAAPILSVKMYLNRRGEEGGDWVHLIQDRGQRRALVNTVRSLAVA
jgi:hypothetical protein